MIKKLTQVEFVEIATNGLPIALFNDNISDYIFNLIKFIEEVNFNIYISDFGTAECSIAISGDELINLVYENGKATFYLKDADLTNDDHKLKVARIISIVYMHSVAWAAIHNDGVISESKIPKICEPWPT
jgi:hypothetical protein